MNNSYNKKYFNLNINLINKIENKKNRKNLIKLRDRFLNKTNYFGIEEKKIKFYKIWYKKINLII